MAPVTFLTTQNQKSATLVLMRKASLLPLLFALGLLAPTPVGAQGANGPRYVDSDPAPGEFLHSAPPGVSISFSEPLGPGSTIAVSDECGQRIDDGDLAVEDNEMQVGLASRPSGDYTVSYTAQGAEDGSGSVPGSFSFLVHLGPDCDGGGPGGHDHGGGGGGMDRGHDADHDPGGASPHGSDHPGSSDHVATDHASMDHKADTEHGKKKRHRHRRGSGPKERGNSPGNEDSNDNLAGPAAAGDDPAPEATGADVLAALGLAAAFGVVGGLILRSSPER